MVEITSEHTFKALKDRKAVDLALMQELVFCYVQGTQYACTRPETHKNINSLLFSCIPKENGQQPFKKSAGWGEGGHDPSRQLWMCIENKLFESLCLALTMMLNWPNGLIYSSPRHTPTHYYSLGRDRQAVRSQFKSKTGGRRVEQLC